MSTLRHLQVEDCHTVETTVGGRIRRVVYPKDAPTYGLVYVHDGMELGELTLVEATDLIETIEILAEHDGHFLPKSKVIKLTQPSWIDRLMGWFLKQPPSP